jgi:hypothetical protein
MKNPTPGSRLGGFGRLGVGIVEMPATLTTDDDASYICRFHRFNNGVGARGGDSELGIAPWTESGEHRIGSVDRGLEHRRIGRGQVRSDDVYLCG